MSAAFVSYGPDNLVYRAAELLRAKAGIKLGARMPAGETYPFGRGHGRRQRGRGGRPCGPLTSFGGSDYQAASCVK